MNFFSFESSKVINKKFSLVLLVVTILVFPLIIKVIFDLSAVDGEIPEGLMADCIAYGVIAYSQIYFFLPAWIVIFTGMELQNGHAQRVIFARSRKFYMISKLTYCIIVTLIFSFLGLFSLIVSIQTSPYHDLQVDLLFYCTFLIQMIMASFGYSILLLALVFIFRSPIRSYVVYIGWTFIEGIVFIIIKSKYDYEIKWLPFHLMRTFYSRNGQSVAANYYNPFTESIHSTIAPLAFTSLLVLFIFYYFSKTDLKPLSD